jgi:hypothetical protein
VQLRLGIDIACRAAHQVSLADEHGRFIWTGRRFRTTPQDLDRLWSMLPEGTDPAEVLVVMEPTRKRVGATGRLVPPPRRRRGAGAAGTLGRSAPLLRQAHLDDALSKLGTDGDHATASADAAIAAQHQLETAYYAGMVGLLSVEDRTERITRRELYRRSSRIGEAVVDVAERVVYAVVKQS